MTRILLTIALPLLLPTALYFLWRIVRQRDRAAWRLHWPWLLGAGVALTAITLFVVSVQFGSAPEGRYVPPRVVDGQVAPAHVAPAAKP